MIEVTDAIKNALELKNYFSRDSVFPLEENSLTMPASYRYKLPHGIDEHILWHLVGGKNLLLLKEIL